MHGFNSDDPEVELGQLDERQAEALARALGSLGAVRLNSEWVPDFEWTPFEVNGEIIGVMEETYIGLSLKGPAHLVEAVANAYYRIMAEE